MKRALIPLMFCVAGVATSQQKSPPLNQRPITVTTLPGVKIAEAVPAVGTNRIYYTTRDDELFAYDRTSRRSTLVSRGKMSEIAISPRNDRIAFGRGSEDNVRDVHIWTMPLDPATGAAVGPARRVSVTAGDAPQFSPDGQRIAFAAKDSVGFDHVAVMPAVGGTERIVDKEPRSLELVRWSPDAQILYFGDWGKKGDKTAAYSIPVSGGTAALMAANTGSNFPGPSPDGRLIVTTNFNWDSLVVADPAGKRLGTIPFRYGADRASWDGSARLFVPNGNSPWKLRAYSLADGSTRALTDSTSDVSQPHWSPDGRRIAVMERGGTLKVMNADGSGARPIAKHVQLLTNCNWSPDGHWIVFTRWVSGNNRGNTWTLRAVEVASGREVTFGRPVTVPQNMGPLMGRWAPVSKSLYYIEPIDTSTGFPVASRFALHEATLSGTDRVLREVTTYRPAASLPAFGDSTIELVTKKGAHVTYPLRSGSPETLLMPESELGVSWPSFSSDGRRVGYRINPTANNSATKMSTIASYYPMLEVMQADGSQRAKISVPFNAVPGPTNPMFLPDTGQLLVAGQDKRGGEISFYRVSRDGKTVKMLLTIPSEYNGRNDILYELSPDGKTLLYVTNEPRYSTFSEADLSAFSKLASARKSP